MTDQANDKTTARLKQLEKMALDLNAEMPTDVMLKGDGSIWVTTHGNAGVKPRRLTQQEVLQLVYSAMKFGERMISV
jgi:hypothetical protein